MQMETWFYAAECKHIPSSFVFHSTKYHYSVTVVGNGSKFLYFLNTKEKQQLAVLKFAVSVVHVSPLHLSPLGSTSKAVAPTETPTQISAQNAIGICCLEDGRIVAINLEEALQSANKGTQDGQSHSRTDDIFASLLGTSNARSRKRNEAMQGEEISVLIAACGDSQIWSLLCALVCNKKLMVCKKSKANGDTLLSIHTSGGCIQRGAVIFPTFHRATCAECVLSSSKIVSQPGSSLKQLRYRPTLKLFQREGTTSFLEREDVVTLDSKLFLKLFGPEVQLSESPVVMVGCDSGHIIYCGLNLVDIDGELKMAPLYSLEQPMVALSASFFQSNKTKSVVDDLLMEDEDLVRPKKVSGVPNALLLVGQRGKIAVCCIGDGEQNRLKFVEFYSPSPITSLILVPNRCIIYSTLCGIHRICLRHDCVEKLDNISNECGPLVIPEMSFKYPERLSPVVMNAVLLEVECGMTTNEEAMDTNGASVSQFQVTLMSLTGGVGSVMVEESVKVLSFPNEHSADQELEKHLKSIEMNSKRVNVVNERLATLNTRLAELNTVLNLLCDTLIAQDGESPTESQPFLCNFSTSFEEIGVSKWKPVIDIELSYNTSIGGKPLGKGWSLLIQSCNKAATENLRRVVTSRVIPLVGLFPSCSIRSRINIELQPDVPLQYSLNCILHYDATELCAGIMDATGSSKTTSILLTTKFFDALDFVQPFKHVPKELLIPLVQIIKPLSQTEEKRDHLNQQYNLELPVFIRSLEQGTLQTSVCEQIFKSLLPSSVVEKALKKDSVSLTAYDGSSLTLTVAPDASTNTAGSSRLDFKNENHCMKVFVKSSSKNMLLEVGNCVRERLENIPVVEKSSVVVQRMTADEKFRGLSKLKVISREVNTIFGELGQLERREEVYDSKVRLSKMTELESRTFKLLCQLQELP